MKLVILTSRFPWPLEKGDKLRIYHQIKYLSTFHEIHLLSIVDHQLPTAALDEMSKYCADIQWFKIGKLKRFLTSLYFWLSGKPAQVGYFFSPRIKKEIYRQIIEIQPDRVYCQLIRMSEYVKTLPFIKVLDYMDTLSLGLEKQAQIRSYPQKLFYKIESRLTKQYEREVFGFFDQTTIISERDRDHLPLLSKESVHVVGNGIDFNFFANDNREKVYDIAFVGNLGYKPNEVAVLTLLEWCKKMNLIGQVTVLIAGARPAASILEIDQTGWTIKGWVEDIRDAYLSARVFVAPLTIGSGLQNKILEAMSCSLPCITTKHVNASIGATNDKEIFIAEQAEEFNKILLKLLKDDEWRKTIGENGRTFVLNNYQWAQFNSKLNSIITNAASRANY